MILNIFFYFYTFPVEIGIVGWETGRRADKFQEYECRDEQ